MFKLKVSAVDRFIAAINRHAPWITAEYPDIARDVWPRRSSIFGRCMHANFIDGNITDDDNHALAVRDDDKHEAAVAWLTRVELGLE